MTANQFGAQWLGKYVAVCDPHGAVFIALTTDKGGI